MEGGLYFIDRDGRQHEAVHLRDPLRVARRATLAKILRAPPRRPVAQCAGCGYLTGNRFAVACCSGHCLDPSGKSCNAWPCPSCSKLHYWTCSFVMPEAFR